MLLWSIFMILKILVCADSARILVVVPTPSVSHQVVFRPITQELVRRGHEVVVITTDPAYPKGQTPENLTEIDVHEPSYTKWRKQFLTITSTGKKEEQELQMFTAFVLLKDLVFAQIKHAEVQKMLSEDRRFDLLVLESWTRPALVYSYFFKAPTVLVSSFGGFLGDFETFGASTHPFVYPYTFNQRINNRTFWDKLLEVYYQYRMNRMYNSLESDENQAIWDNFGQDVPPLSELRKNVQMLFLNVHPIWDSNRPVPPSVVYIGGIHHSPEKKLPKDLESYLNSSKNGVIYVSFGTNVKPSAIDSDKIQTMVNVFSELPYDVLWKWDRDELPGRTPNIKISKWFPQSDLLRHPKIKLFVTQAGLQSTDEAILAGVPLLGIPMLGDQWFNAEMYVKHGLGLSLDMDALTHAVLKEAVQTIISDERYRRNVVRLSSVVRDQPEPPLQRAMWRMEHVMRHGGASHLRAAGADLAWTEYIQLHLVMVLLFSACILVTVLGVILYCTYVCVGMILTAKVKQN